MPPTGSRSEGSGRRGMRLLTRSVDRGSGGQYQMGKRNRGWRRQLLAGGGLHGGASPEDMRSGGPVSGLERDQAEEIGGRTGNYLGGKRAGQLGHGGRAAASRDSGRRRARAAAGAGGAALQVQRRARDRGDPCNGERGWGGGSPRPELTGRAAKQGRRRAP
jgi:hypothetical protein